MSSTTGMTFQSAQHDGAPQEPRAALIEIVERHFAVKKPYTGVDSVLVPNHIRINGTAVWATYDAPITIEEIVVDGSCREPFAVTLRLLARAVRVGSAPSFVAAAQGPDEQDCAVVEIPDTDSWSDGDVLERPYVLLNGRRIYTTGPVRVGPLGVGKVEGAAMVELTVLCRKLTVDDEPRAAPGE